MTKWDRDENGKFFLRNETFTELREAQGAVGEERWFYNGYSALMYDDNGEFDKWEEKMLDEGHSLERTDCDTCDKGYCEYAAEAYRRDHVIGGVPAWAGDTAMKPHSSRAQFIETFDPETAKMLLDKLEKVWVAASSVPVVHRELAPLFEDDK